MSQMDLTKAESERVPRWSSASSSSISCFGVAQLSFKDLGEELLRHQFKLLELLLDGDPHRLDLRERLRMPSLGYR